MNEKTTSIEIESKNLKILQQSPKLLEEPAILESLLLPIELFALKTILEKNTPLSTNQVHDITVRKVWADAIKEGRDVMPSLAGEPTPLKGTSSHRPLLPEDNVTFSNKDIAILRAELMEGKIKYPSYDKIKAVLEGLESWGILTRRYEGRESKKYFWILQPAFEIQLRKNILHYLNERNSVLTW